MTYVHLFVSAKGGQGLTTVATMVAILNAEEGIKTLLVGTSDTLPVAGFPDNEEGFLREAIPNLDVELDLVRAPEHRNDYDLIVADGSPVGFQPNRTTLVTQPCYIALRRAMRLSDGFFDDVCFMDQPERALRTGDVEAVLGREVVAKAPWDTAVARAVDAGTLAMRTPSTSRRALHSFILKSDGIEDAP